MSEKSEIHRKGEAQVRADIKQGDSNYEIIGRESDPMVAEAMAYAAKPLIEDALESLELKPNDGLATFEIDGKKVLNKLPGVVTEHGTEVPYTQIRGNVADAHDAANKVQVEYYDKVAAARQAVRDAQAELDRLTTSV